MSNIPELQNIPDVSFIDNLTLAQVREQIFQDYATKYRELTGEDAVLSDADPIRLVLLTFAQQFYQGLQFVDWTGKKNLLKYSYGEALDNLAANKGITRKPASYAAATLQFSLQNARTSATGIPAGTRVSNHTGVYFMTTTYAEIPAGEISTTAPGVALEAGEAYNGIPMGTIIQIVDPVPYIYAVTNTTVSAGGADMEDDDGLTERIYLYPSNYSTAGAESAYIYWAKTYRSDVSDVMAYSPAAGEVKVLFLLDSGIPGDSDVNGMAEHLSAKTIRPLTDKLTVQAPTIVTYNLELAYYIDRADSAQATTIQTKVAAAIADYKMWQQAIGRDINPSQLIRRIMEAGAKRVEVLQPAYTPVDPTAVAVIGTETISYGGLEEG